MSMVDEKVKNLVPIIGEVIRYLREKCSAKKLDPFKKLNISEIYEWFRTDTRYEPDLPLIILALIFLDGTFVHLYIDNHPDLLSLEFRPIIYEQ